MANKVLNQQNKPKFTKVQDKFSKFVYKVSLFFLVIFSKPVSVMDCVVFKYHVSIIRQS